MGSRYIYPNTQDGFAIFVCAMTGLLVSLLGAYGLVRLMPERLQRATTISLGSISAVILAWLLTDFVGDRMRLAEEFDAAYAEMPSYDVALDHQFEGRRPLNTIEFASPERRFSAGRPGGWQCEGDATREQDYELYRAISVASKSFGANCSNLKIRYRAADIELDTCVANDRNAAALIAAADTLVTANERISSCTRAAD